MLKNDLRLLDMDEDSREIREKQFEKEIAACKVLGLIFDVATSDVTIYVENCRGEILALD